jgi:hydroxymethylpyrimidine kinase/phosphomethylpyrimidine kinase/thiamine-phosphate diphosphorylase
MPWQPHGVTGLAYWQRVLSADYPLVAIGGINEARAEQIAKTGVSGIALITAITHAADPELACRNLLSLCRSQT